MIQTDLQMSSESFGLLLPSPAFSWCMDHYGSRIVCLLLGFPSSTSVSVFVPRFVIGLQSAFHVPKVALLCSSPATTISSCALQVRDPYRLYDCNTELKLSSAGLKRKLRHKDNKKMSINEQWLQSLQSFGPRLEGNKPETNLLSGKAKSKKPLSFIFIVDLMCRHIKIHQVISSRWRSAECTWKGWPSFLRKD